VAAVVVNGVSPVTIRAEREGPVTTGYAMVTKKRNQSNHWLRWEMGSIRGDDSCATPSPDVRINGELGFCGLGFGFGLSPCLLLEHAPQGMQVDQDVDQRVLVGDGLLVAQLGPLNA